MSFLFCFNITYRLGIGSKPACVVMWPPHLSDPYSEGLKIINEKVFPLLTHIEIKLSVAEQ